MQKPTEKTSKMLFKTEQELFDALVPPDNAFRKLNPIIDFEKLTNPLRDLYSDLGPTGIDVAKGFKALLVQFWEDYSDRQMEQAVQENLAVRWF
ncbi:MAG: transposase [Patescibacteria group bacterium]